MASLSAVTLFASVMTAKQVGLKNFCKPLFIASRRDVLDSFISLLKDYTKEVREHSQVLLIRLI